MLLEKGVKRMIKENEEKWENSDLYKINTTFFFKKIADNKEKKSKIKNSCKNHQKGIIQHYVNYLLTLSGGN